MAILTTTTNYDLENSGSLPFTLVGYSGSGLSSAGTAGRWCFDSDTTGSSNTGPSGPKTGTYYWYTETTSTIDGAVFTMEYTETLDAGSYNYLLDFWYSNYGVDGNGECLIQYWNGASWDTVQTLGWNKSWPGPWIAATQIDLSSYSNADGKIRWNFNAVADPQFFSNDFGLDDITFTVEVASSSSTSSSSTSSSSSSISSSSISSSSSSLSSSSLSSSSSSLSSSSSSTLQEPFWWGTSSTPYNAPGTGATNYTIIGKDAGGVVPEGGYVTQIQVYTTGASTMDFAAFDGPSAGGSDLYTDTTWIQSIPVTAGFNQLNENIDYPGGFAVSAGQWLGFYTNTTDVKADFAPDSLYDSGDQIGDGSATTFYTEARDYQIRYYIEYDTSVSSSSVSSSSVSISSSSLSSSSTSSSSSSSSTSSSSSSSTSSSSLSSSSSSFSITEGFWYGKDGIPNWGSNAIHYSNATIVPLAETPVVAQGVPSGGYIDIIQCYLYDPGTYKFSTFTRSGSLYTDENFISIPFAGTRVVGLTTAFAGTDFNASELAISAGQYFGFIGAGSEMYVNTTGGPGYYYDWDDQIGDNTPSTFSWNSDDTVQFRAHIAYSLISSSSSSSSSSVSISSSSESISSSSESISSSSVSSSSSSVSSSSGSSSSSTFSSSSTSRSSLSLNTSPCRS